MPAEAILRKAKLLRQYPSLKNATVMLSGKAGVQLVALLSQPVLARLYSPTQFGEFALFNGFLTLLLIAASGRYEAAIVYTKKELHAQRLFQLSQLILFGYTAFLFMLVTLSYLSGWSGNVEIPFYYLWLLPLFVLCIGYWQIVENWLVRFRKFSQLSLVSLTHRLLIFGGAVLAIFLPTQLNGLILGLLIGAIGVFGIAIYQSRQSAVIPPRRLLGYAQRFRDFPLFSIPSLFLSLALLHLPVIWISYFHTSSMAGSFSMAFMLVSLPYSCICLGIAPVFHERMLQLNLHEQHSLLKKVCLYYGTFAIFMALAAYLIGETFTVWLLSDKWLQTGVIITILSPLLICQGLELWLLISLNVSRKMHISMRMHGLKLALWVIALGAGTYTQDLLLSFKLMSIFSILHLLLLAYIVIRMDRNCAADSKLSIL